MIQEFYGLDLDAFSLSPDLDFLFLSDVHEEAVAHLLYGLEQNEDIILIVGDIGTGKTLTLHRVLTQVSSAFIPVSINVTTMDFEQLLRLALLKLDFDARGDASLAFLVDAFEKQLVSIRGTGKKVLLIVDEAQNLPVEVLESLRLLLNLAQPGGQALQLVLTGQLGLRVNMNRPEMRQLRQRIRVDYEFGFLNREEVEEYILHRLKTAGRTASLFEEKALDRIFHLSQGVPRVVNILASKALLAGFVDGSKKIKHKHLDDIPLDDLLDTPAPKEIPFIGGTAIAETAEPEPSVPEPTAPEPIAPEPVAPEPVAPEPAAPKPVAHESVESAIDRLEPVATDPEPESEPEPDPEIEKIAARIQESAPGGPDFSPEPSALPEKASIGRGWLITAMFFLAIIAAAVSYPIWSPMLGIESTSEVTVDTPPALPSAVVEETPVETEPEGAEVESPVPEDIAQSENPEKVVVAPGEKYLLHVASFAMEDRASNFARQLHGKGVEAFVKPFTNDSNKVWHRVYIGPYPTQQEASEVATTFKENGWIQFCRITTPDPNWPSE